MAKINMNMARLMAAIKAQEQIDKGADVYLSNGNKKYKSNGRVYFFIFNLPAVVTCPGACHGCKNDCYAKKAEYAYPTCLPCRMRNYLLSLRDDFVDRVVKAIRKKLDNPRCKAYKVLQNGGKIVVRVHESGDFYSLDYLKKWLKIASMLPEVEFVFYTKSDEIFEQVDPSEVPVNFRKGANFSLWEDMPETQKQRLLALAKAWGVRCYTALWATTKQAIEHGCTESLENTTRDYVPCKCDNCATCQICWKSKKLYTIVAIH